MKSGATEKCGPRQAGVLAALFMVLIWLPTLDSVLQLDHAPLSNENRTLAGFPEFRASQGGLRQFIAGVEAYFNDHFGFRKRLIRWQHKWNHEIFKESFRDDVLSGRDGWLYFSGEHMIENLRGMSRFTPDELQAWQKLLESRRDWCARHGAAYIFVIPPDKHSVYPEHLPEWLLPVKRPNKLDQFIAYLKTNSTVPVADLRPVLGAAKTNEIMYLLTDTHWNELGAFAGYQGLITALSGQLPGLKPLPLAAFERKLEPKMGGDLARMLGQDQSTTETENRVLSPRPPLKPLAVTVDTNLLVKKWLKITEPTCTTNPEGIGKVVVFHDSFTLAWVPFLGYNFHQVIYIWQYKWDMALLEKQKPDVVIDEMLERFVLSKDPNNLTENW